jgi:hypothetical protein
VHEVHEFAVFLFLFLFFKIGLRQKANIIEKQKKNAPSLRGGSTPRVQDTAM